MVCLNINLSFEILGGLIVMRKREEMNDFQKGCGCALAIVIVCIVAYLLISGICELVSYIFHSAK